MIEALFYEKMDSKKVHCFLCAHQCVIQMGMFGICGVRKNIDGDLFSFAYGDLIAANVDPIEKKPLYHFKPGSTSYSVATQGCNFKCGFCQNWQISQSNISENRINSSKWPPEKIVSEAKRNHCESISFTYTEPTIFFEYALDIAKCAKSAGLSTVFVSNGYMTEQAIEKIQPYLDACNIDLKSFRDDFYLKFCKAHLNPVLNSIKALYNAGIWLEITTLLVTGENDSDEEIREIAEFISKIDTSIPWHVSRFFPQYEFTNHQPTPIETIFRAEKIGRSSGLQFVYPGNIQDKSDTRCFSCDKLLVERSGFQIKKNSIVDGYCPQCKSRIPGEW